MKGEPYFFKVTGRLMVRNIMKVIAACKPDTNYFNITSLRSLRAIDTRFYGVSVDAFRMALLDAYRSVNDNAFYYYEMSFRDALKRHRVPFRPSSASRKYAVSVVLEVGIKQADKAYISTFRSKIWFSTLL